MVGSRWLRWFGPGLTVLGAVGAIGSAASGVAGRPWLPPPCAAGSLTAAATASPASVSGTTWFRIDARLGDDGALVGQRLTVGLAGSAASRTQDLPPESFAAGPFGRVVLVGSDDGRHSVLRALDVQADCSWPIDDSDDVIRRATIDPAGTTVYEMRVARVGRADLGIWRHGPDRMTDAERLLDAPVPDPRFGMTFSTEFRWTAAGDRLIVQSCGEVACRAQVLMSDGTRVGALADPRLGTLVGADGDTLVTYAACRGLPCPVVATDLRSGTSRPLLADGGAAIVTSTADGPRVVDEIAAGSERHLRSTRLDGGGSIDLGALPVGTGLVPSAERAGSAATLPDGWILLGPDGRLPTDATTPAWIRRVPDGSTVQFGETDR